MCIRDSRVTGWDISENALKIAQGNIALLDAGNVKIEYQAALKLAETSDTGRWNIIVSNPCLLYTYKELIIRRNAVLARLLSLSCQNEEDYEKNKLCIRDR